MRTVLEITSGTDRGRKALLFPGQTLRVGRTEWAEFAVPHDSRLSGVHFALETDSTQCYAEDLGSTNGTLLNGVPMVGKVAVRDGDVIHAGATKFTVHKEDAGDEDTTTSGTGAELGPDAAVAGQRPARAVVTCTADRCRSGLIRLHGNSDQARPTDLAARLSRATPLHLIVDFNRPALPRPEKLARPAFLIDWLPEESRAEYSPVVLSACDPVDLLALVDAAWGKDALIGVYSNEDQPALLKRVRPAAGAFARPSVLTPQLTVGTPAFVGNLLAGIDAVLVEGAVPAEWSLFVTSGFDQTLRELGFAWQEAHTD